jgi:uncharacterized protein with HEPN domain
VRDAEERIRDIPEAIAAIERYLDRGRAAFGQGALLRAGLVRRLQTTGEAARALPEEVLAMASSIEWTTIIGMRNVLVYRYFNIDLDNVWGVAARDVPALKRSMERPLRRWEKLGYAG